MATELKSANLNLKVSEDERWGFKELCVKHRMSQVDAFRLAVRLLKEHLGEPDGVTSRGRGG